mgnify:FL=1
MNSIEREQIIALRAAGQSYARIADALNLSVNSVKSFCRRNALSGSAGSSVKPIKAEAPLEATACEQCGCPVRQTPGRKHKRFCSDACRTAWWNAHRTQVCRKTMRTFCCGMQFSRYGVTRRSFCSRSCASAARKKEFTHDA